METAICLINGFTLLKMLILNEVFNFTVFELIQIVLSDRFEANDFMQFAEF